MSFRRALWAFAVAVCLAAPVAVRAQGEYLDVLTVKVKPEKLTDFQALTKRFAEANRKFNGDRWLALQSVYGEANVYQFTSVRKDYADIDKANEAGEKKPDTAPVFVSQVIEGGKGAIFYVSTLRSSMGGFDHNPITKEILGEEGFKKFQQISADSVEVADSTLYRFDPSISNPPDDGAKVAMDFWHPKAVIVAAAKPRTAMDPDAAKDAPKKP